MEKYNDCEFFKLLENQIKAREIQCKVYKCEIDKQTRFLCNKCNTNNYYFFNPLRDHINSYEIQYKKYKREIEELKSMLKNCKDLLFKIFE